MQHDQGTKYDLIIYRLSTTKEELRDAKLLYNAKSYKSANNRAYYAIFHGINAVHALKGNGYKKHKDAIANFNKEYVKTEIFPREVGRNISKAQKIRHVSDYDDFYIATAEEALKQINHAEEILLLIESYCNKFMNDGLHE